MFVFAVGATVPILTVTVAGVVVFGRTGAFYLNKIKKIGAVAMIFVSVVILILQAMRLMN